MRLARCLSFVVLLITVSETPASTPWEARNRRHTVTVDYLYEACSEIGTTAKGDIPYFDCESYVYGMLDAYVKVRDRIPTTERACFPANIEPWRVLEMANPKPGTYDRKQTATSFLIDFLRKRYPCS